MVHRLEPFYEGMDPLMKAYKICFDLSTCAIRRCKLQLRKRQTDGLWSFLFFDGDEHFKEELVADSMARVPDDFETGSERTFWSEPCVEGKTITVFFGSRK